MIKLTTVSKLRSLCVILAIAFLLFGCASKKLSPEDYNDICTIFSVKKNWYRAAQKSTERWGGNLQLPMAIIYQESLFKKNARPKRKKILGIFPGARPSDAYGYSQALKSTWQEYKDQTKNRRARRDNFKHSFDFIQWYINKSYTINGVSKWSYGDQYLNYHEGHGGFQRQTYLKKVWLNKVANRIKLRAERYQKQLSSCNI